MTVQELNQEFDILYQNIMSNQAPGLDEYEKSVFLTQAQEQLVIDIYNGTFNESPFEDIEENRRYLNNLIVEVTINTPITGHIGISNKSRFYQLPEDVWFRTYESVKLIKIDEDDPLKECLSGKTILVKPITQDDYFKISRNPFKKDNENKVLRLDINDRVIELISDYNLEGYYLRYVKKPEPIILIDLPGGLTINNETTARTSVLNSIFHRTILEKAVELAKKAWTAE